MTRGPVSFLVLVLVFAAVLVLTNPLGDFPLNDDWSYGQAVQSLAQNRPADTICSFASSALLTSQGENCKLA
ncbi:hypothetical protein JXD38_12365 [candidate division WOR-3 bacterium]|nr:hypothetical protein [candidate division WOR-3 bacterium]